MSHDQLRTFAGAVVRDATPSESLVARLHAAVARDSGAAAVTVVRKGALVVAFTGSSPARDGAALCLAEGVVDIGGDERAILDAWRTGGDAAIAALRGDFALVLWDGRTGVIARDHQGMRGLYHHDDGSTLVFAGEVGVVIEALPVTPGPDPVGFAHWLGISAPPQDRTLVDGIRQVPPAGVVDLTPGRTRPRRHWDPTYRSPAPVTLEEGAAQVRDGLVTAIGRRARGADATGVLLSGGLDSSSVAALARTALAPEEAPRRAYSAVFPNHRSVDESPLIGSLCEELGLAPVQAVVRTAGLLPGVVPFVERFRVPPVSPNMFFWMPLLERAAADGTAVMLDGEGGDELYGASVYLITDRLARGRVRAAAEVVRALPGAHRGVSSKTVRSWLVKYGAAGFVPAWAHDAYAAVRPSRLPVPWLAPQTAKAFREGREPGGWKRLDGPRWWAWMVHATTRIGASMAYEHIRHRASQAGIISRHPLVDIDVHGLVLSLPPELALDARFSRPVLREAVKGVLPDAVRLRPDKSTFDEVFHAALAGPELPVAKALLGPDARVAAFADIAAIQRDLLEPGAPAGFYGRQWWALQVWRLLTAECFLRGLEDRDGPRRAVDAVAPPPPDVEIVGGALQL